MGDNLYVKTWEKYLPQILEAIKKKNSEEFKLYLSASDFESSGNRKKSGYKFNLVIIEGKVENNISGSAVARDLFQVLNSNNEAQKLLKGNRAKISQREGFELNIFVNSF